MQTNEGTLDITQYLTEDEVRERANDILSKPFAFGHAILLLKFGEKVARDGWNGKGMWLKLIESRKEGGYDVNDHDMDEYELLQWIGMKTADNKFVPWLASQSDMLAEDWGLVQ